MTPVRPRPRPTPSYRRSVSGHLEDEDEDEDEAVAVTAGRTTGHHCLAVSLLEDHRRRSAFKPVMRCHEPEPWEGESPRFAIKGPHR
ncbi:hypothetical protein ACIOTI_13540 [Streptomyces sp. NPDC087843]|uniref:hypothetical protein n=1 Tax=Streptomyces sp. NPDC087843 TaxID=3365804 RepID=UPI00381E04DD